MNIITKRDFLRFLGVGAMVAGAGPSLGSRAAQAGAVPDWAVLPEGTEPRHGGKLVYAQTYPNWAIGSSDRGEHPYYWIDLLTRSIWNCLTWVDHDYALRGELATSWEPVDETMSKWDFRLREGVLFHNGLEMTAADVVSSINAHVAQRGSGFVVQWVENVEALGKYTVRMNLVAGYAEWPFAMADYRVVIWPAGEAESLGFDGIGTGPYKLVEIDNKRGFRAVRNDNYWLEGRPYADEVEGYIATSQTAINGFRSGQFNAVFNIDPTTAGQFESAGGLVHRSSGGDQFLLVLPKNIDMVWNDVRVRRAITLAIDRNAINTIVYNDPNSWVGNDTHMTALNPEFLPRETPYDIDEAKRLLSEAGYPDGITLPTIVFCPSFPEEPRIMAIVAESLKSAGIELELREMPCDGFNDYNLAVNAPVGRPRRSLVGPRNAAINLGRMDITYAGGNENGGWTGTLAEAYFELYARALAEPDDDKRIEMYHELQRLAQEDVPAIVLGGRRNMLAHASNVSNLRSHSQNWSTRFDDFWIDG